MIRFAMPISLLALSLASVAPAQPAPAYSYSGTRLDIFATGEVTRVPDIVRIGAGVVSMAPTATEAIGQNNARMAAVRAALTRAGVADRDIQTSAVSLNPEYRYAENQPPALTGYRASNEVSIRFRDIANAGKILDALVAQGANQINGPTLALDKPEAALDEARTAALASARQRADLYARTLSQRVRRIVSISEAGSIAPPMPRPMQMAARDGAAAEMKIDPGEQVVAVSLSVSFELE